MVCNLDGKIIRLEVGDLVSCYLYSTKPELNNKPLIGMVLKARNLLKTADVHFFNANKWEIAHKQVKVHYSRLAKPKEPDPE